MLRNGLCCRGYRSRIGVSRCGVIPPQEPALVDFGDRRCFGAPAAKLPSLSSESRRLSGLLFSRPTDFPPRSFARRCLGMGARAELSAALEGFDRSPSQMKVALACRNKDSLTGARLCWAAPIRSGARKNLGNGSPPVQSRIKPHHGRGEELALRNTAAKNSRRTGPGVCTLLHPRPGPSSAGLVHCGKWRL